MPNTSGNGRRENDGAIGEDRVADECGDELEDATEQRTTSRRKRRTGGGGKRRSRRRPVAIRGESNPEKCGREEEERGGGEKEGGSFRVFVRDVEKAERGRGEMPGEERGRSSETDSTVRETTDLM